MRTGLILMAALILLGGFGYYYYREVQLIENISYSLIGINLDSASAALTTVTLDLRLTSQSTIDAQINELFVDVYLNNIKVGSVQQVQPFIIPAMGYADASLNVNFSPELLIGDALNLISTGAAAGQNTTVMLNGYASVKSSFLSVTVPIQYTTTIAQIMAP